MTEKLTVAQPYNFDKKFYKQAGITEPLVFTDLITDLLPAFDSLEAALHKLQPADRQNFLEQFANRAQIPAGKLSEFCEKFGYDPAFTTFYGMGENHFLITSQLGKTQVFEVIKLYDFSHKTINSASSLRVDFSFIQNQSGKIVILSLPFEVQSCFLIYQPKGRNNSKITNENGIFSIECNALGAVSNPNSTQLAFVHYFHEMYHDKNWNESGLASEISASEFSLAVIEYLKSMGLSVDGTLSKKEIISVMEEKIASYAETEVKTSSKDRIFRKIKKVFTNMWFFSK